MRYSYRVTITDSFPACPGVTIRHFASKKEALWYADNEMKAATELFNDGRANLSVKIDRVCNLTRAGTIWAAELGIEP